MEYRGTRAAETAADEPQEQAPASNGLLALVEEYLPLNRRRIGGDPPLAPAEVERWEEMREIFEYTFGSANPPLRGTRRRALRVPTQLKVRLGAEAVADLHNLSECGAFIATADRIDPTAALTLELDPGNGEPPLQVGGVVKWCRELSNMNGPAGAGVEFADLEDGDFAALARLVESALVAAGRGGA